MKPVLNIQQYEMKIYILLIIILSRALCQMGTPPDFPEGESSLQISIGKTIKITCSENPGNSTEIVLHVLKGNPKLLKTKPSLFTKQNASDFYFFLTQVDSSSLYTDDCDYSMLKFLRYITKANNLQFLVIDSTDELVNQQKLRMVRFSSPIKMFIFEDNISYETFFTNWTEYWECGNKLDYAPAYPFIKPEECRLMKINTEGLEESLYYYMTHPVFVFSAIGKNKQAEDILGSLSGMSKKLEIESNSGNELEGFSIDINNDLIDDAFWYIGVKKSNVIEWFARLYINISGEWVLMWYTYFNEMQ
jgi:hypothetical protein